ncbi:AAA family ATPase [Pseudanabaenaceae cyanobacterium LEGE 13415]|nr:AAA family ATPase [Pseudanabaenaceae cyanobacterium LEGE 13415]
MQSETSVNSLLPFLQWLDPRLESAIATIEQNSTEEKHDQTTELIAPEGSRLAQLQQHFDLSDFDLQLLAIAIAPELDRRYDRLYAYLQEDNRAKRPTVDLALNLTGASAIEKLERRAHFATTAPLIQHNLLHLVGSISKPTLLAHELHPDEQVIRFLLGQPGLDRSLLSSCQLLTPDDPLDQLPIDEDLKQSCTKLVLDYWQQEKPLRLYFQGSDRHLHRQFISAIAQSLQVPLLVANCSLLNDELPDLIPRLFREAWFQQAILYFENLDALKTELHSSLEHSLKHSCGITCLSPTQAWQTTIEGFTIPFAPLTFHQRRTIWKTQLEQANITLDEADLNVLGDRFRLTPQQIVAAIRTVVHTIEWQPTPATITPLRDRIFAAARTHSSQALETLARKIEPYYDWADLVLPEDQEQQLRELCNQAQFHYQVYETWGFNQKFSQGKGLSALFSGPPGTGKTMAAEVIAQTLQLDLYKIDLSQVVSKYIGETEKNLDRIFTAAANSNAILLFDEADSLFGKRSETQNAHDRYANLEVSYLLQQIEQYEGLAILTTNLRSNLDEAFIRRLRCIIDFSHPDFYQRYQIWQHIWTDKTPLHPEVDLKYLAQRFEVTGATIRNSALAAAFLAASDGGVVTNEHLIHAIHREYQKMGKLLS